MWFFLHTIHCPQSRNQQGHVFQMHKYKVHFTIQVDRKPAYFQAQVKPRLFSRVNRNELMIRENSVEAQGKFGWGALRWPWGCSKNVTRLKRVRNVGIQQGNLKHVGYWGICVYDDMCKVIQTGLLSFTSIWKVLFLSPFTRSHLLGTQFTNLFEIYFGNFVGHRLALFIWKQ